MDDFSDLFFDQDFGAPSQRKDFVPAPPAAIEDSFLSQVFQWSPELGSHFSLTQNETSTSDKSEVSRQPCAPSFTPEVQQTLNPKINSSQSQVVQSSQAQQVQRFFRLREPSTKQKVVNRTGGRHTPFVPPKRKPQVNVTPFKNTTMPPLPLELPGATPQGSENGTLRLRPVSEIPESYHAIFPFPYFNAVQSKVLDDVLYSNRPVIVCAPTGSGKTVLFELAIIRLLMLNHGTMTSKTKIVYMAPIKALCTERFEDWQNKFGPLGLKCKELTGDTEMDDYFELQDVNIILTTPEKWDSMTRRWRDNKSLVQLVRLFLVDEVHMLNDHTRGPTMEAVVSRMKTINSVFKSEWAGKNQQSQLGMRFIAVSATIPNVSDVGEWLSTDNLKAACHRLDDSHRPVRLRKVVLGFPCSDNQSEFRFDLSLNYKLANIVDMYSEQKPALVFCSTRKGVQQAASTLVKDAHFILNPQHKVRLMQVANTVRDSKLRDVVMQGVGYHHAGLDLQDRKAIEAVFTAGDLPVLMATSTLAMGVNLPAHLVIVKSTQHYVMGSYEEYSETNILQMIGRAGRPQFDITATAVIMTRSSTKHKYEALVNGMQHVESSLHQNLVEHLNAEVVLNTISDVSVAVEWIKSTFLYIRIMKNPTNYGLAAGFSKEKIEQKLQDLCLQNLNSLAGVNLIQMDQDGFGLKATETGRLMARYCIAFGTMKQLQCVQGTETVSELLTILCRSQEFKDIQLRNNEKKLLNTLNKDKNRATIRYPMDGKIKTNFMKVNCLIQSSLGCLTVQDFALSSDSVKIFRSAVRISKCLVEVLWNKPEHKALLNAVLLSKCMKAKLWENSKHVSRQLTGIGDKMANMLVNAGLATFQKIEDTNPREIELIVNRHPPFGNQVKDAATRLPKYELFIDQTGSYFEHTAELTIRVSMVNAVVVKGKSSASAGHTCVLLVGDADNKIVFRARVSDSMLINGDAWIKRIHIKRTKTSDELSVSIVSQDFVGLDVHSNYTPFYTGTKSVNRSKEDCFQPSQIVKEKTAHQQGQTQPDLQGEAATGWDQHLPPGRRVCSHHCLNKATCAHECCKYGVAVKRQRLGLDSYLQNVKQQVATIPQVPNNKRMKPDSAGPQALISQYMYTPQYTPRLARTPSSSTDYPQDMPSGSQGGAPWRPNPPSRTPISGGWDVLDLHQQRVQACRMQDDKDTAMVAESGGFGYEDEETWSGGEARDDWFEVEDFQSSLPQEDDTLPDLEYRQSGRPHSDIDEQHSAVKSSYFSQACSWDDPIVIEDFEEDFTIPGDDMSYHFGEEPAHCQLPNRSQSKFASVFKHQAATAKSSLMSDFPKCNTDQVNMFRYLAGPGQSTTGNYKAPGFQKASLMLREQKKPFAQNPYIPRYPESESDSDFEETTRAAFPRRTHEETTRDVSATFPHRTHEETTRDVSATFPHRTHEETTRDVSAAFPHRTHEETTRDVSAAFPHRIHEKGPSARTLPKAPNIHGPQTGIPLKDRPSRPQQNEGVNKVAVPTWDAKGFSVNAQDRGLSMPQPYDPVVPSTTADTSYNFADDVANFSLGDYEWSDTEEDPPPTIDPPMLSKPSSAFQNPLDMLLDSPVFVTSVGAIDEGCKFMPNAQLLFNTSQNSEAMAAEQASPSACQQSGQTNKINEVLDIYKDIFKDLF